MKGLEQNTFRNSERKAVKKSVLFERSEFRDFQLYSLNFSILLTALIFLTVRRRGSLDQAKNEGHTGQVTRPV